jgi:serine/threonine-protein kinase HipA
MIKEGNVYFGDVLAGLIRETDEGYEFIYDTNYLEMQDARPISLTMPLSGKSYQSKVLFPFFDGLIPEGWLLDIAVEHWKVKPNDRFQLLMASCRDAIGAVSVIPLTDKSEQ